MNYVLVKQEKSVGISLLLTLLFGPLGLFYSTVKGGLIMTFLYPVFIGLSVFVLIGGAAFDNPELILGSFAVIIIALIFYTAICLVWSVTAVNHYNEKIRAEIRRQNQQAKITSQSPSNHLKKCEYCAEPIQKEAKICRYCNREQSVPTAADLNLEEENKVIAASKNSYNSSSKNSIVQQNINLKQQQRKKELQTTLIAFSVVLFLAILISVIWKYDWLSLHSNASNQDKITTVHGEYPFTGTKLISSKDLKLYSKSELKLMRNEIFARHGFVFKHGGELDNYFRGQNWYHANPNYSNDSLNLYEKANIHIIVEEEKKR